MKNSIRNPGYLLQNVLICLGSTLLAFLCLEIACRALGLRGEASWTMEHAMVVKDHILNYRIKPNSITFVGDVSYRINSKGFRDVERSYAKGQDIKRILVLGDSVAYGYKVKFEDIFARRLERLLAGSGATDKVEAISLAIPGLNTFQESHLLSAEGTRYDPDLVVVLYVLNDAESGVSYNFSKKPCRIELLGLPISCAAKDFIKKSALLYLMKDRLDNLLWRMNVGDNDDVFHSIKSDYFSKLYTQGSNWENNVVEGFKQFSNFAAARNTQVILVIFPIMFDFDHYRWSWIHEKVASEGRKNNFHVLDLLEEFRKFPITSARVERGDFVHPNSFGHELAAKATLEFLDKDRDIF